MHVVRFLFGLLKEVYSQGEETGAPMEQLLRHEIDLTHNLTC